MGWGDSMRARPLGTRYPLITMSLSVSLHAHMHGVINMRDSRM